MPEKEMAIDADNASPAKKSKPSPVARTGNALAQITLLDGSVLDVYTDVSVRINSILL